MKLDLKAPKIKEASDDKNLLPNAAKDTLTAVVDYVGMALQDKIIVTWTGAPGTPAGGSHTAPEKTVTVLGPQEIPLANSVVAFNLSKPVTVDYTVKRGAAAPQPSTSLPLAVQALNLDLSNVPKILQAANNGDGTTLDLSAIATAGTIHAPNWPLIALNQYVWLWLKGTLSPGDTPYEVLLWKAPNARVNQAWVDKAYVHPLAAAELNTLKQLKNASTLSIEFKAALGQSLNVAEAVTFPTRTYTVIAIEDIKPKITSVKGSPSGVDIPQNGLTVETAVILTGTATNGQNVKILDGNTDKGDATANPVTGIWTKTVSGLGITLHSLTAKALYVSGQVSDPWPLTVTPVVVHTIDKVLDNKGEEILPGGTTVSPTVTVSGKASKGQSVEVWEGTGTTAVVLGTAIADVTTGIWEETFPLALGPRRLVAKRLYTGAPEWSNDRLLTVVALVNPTIDTIKDPAGTLIQEGATTVSTTLNMEGKASEGQRIEMLEGTGAGAVSKGTAIADPKTGIWKMSVTVAVGPRRFAAKSLYHSSDTYSNVRLLTVSASAPTSGKENFPASDRFDLVHVGDSHTTKNSLEISVIRDRGALKTFVGAASYKPPTTCGIHSGDRSIVSYKLNGHARTLKIKYSYGKSAPSYPDLRCLVRIHDIGGALVNTDEIQATSSGEHHYIKTIPAGFSYFETELLNSGNWLIILEIEWIQ